MMQLAAARARSLISARRNQPLLLAVFGFVLAIALDFFLVNRLAVMRESDTAAVLAIAGSSLLFTFAALVLTVRAKVSWFWRGPVAFLVAGHALLKVGLAVDFFFFA